MKGRVFRPRCSTLSRVRRHELLKHDRQAFFSGNEPTHRDRMFRGQIAAVLVKSLLDFVIRQFQLISGRPDNAGAGSSFETPFSAILQLQL